MLNLTTQEKNLYNTFLYISRTIKNKPFTSRKNFDEISDKDKICLKRISILLNKYPHIDSKFYFKAPYEIYKDEEYFDLEFYSNMSGVKAYTLCMKQLQEKDPDSDEQIEFIIKSLKFIGAFCLRNNISLNDYITHKTGVTYDWMKHIKQHIISVYSLMEFSGVFDVISKTPKEEQVLFLGDVSDYFYSYKEKYLKSTKAKYLIEQSIQKINTIINKSNA